MHLLKPEVSLHNSLKKIVLQLFFFKVILYSYLILKKMNERITDS